MPSEYNVVTDFGAVGDGVASDATAFANAFAALDTGDTLILPTADVAYNLGATPIWLRASGVRIQGANDDGVELRFTHNSGFSVLQNADLSATFTPITTNLVGGGSSNAIRFSGTYHGWYNLSDDRFVGEYGGTSSVTVRCYINCTGTTSGVIAASSARLGSYGTTSTSLVFGINAGNIPYLILNLGGTAHQVISPSGFSAGALHFLEANYDGTNMRIFIDGVLMATQPATGTITRNYWEEFTFGAMIQQWPDYSVQSWAPPCTIDSFNVDKRCLNTATYVPPTNKLAASFTNTLMLVNCDAVLGDATRGVNINLGASWLAWRQVDYGGAGAISGNQWENVRLGCQNIAAGLLAQSSVNCAYRNMQIFGSTGYTMFLRDNCYESIVDDCLLNCATPAVNSIGARANFVIGPQSGLTKVSNVYPRGGMQSLTCNGGGIEFDNCTPITESDIVTPIWINNATVGNGVTLFHTQPDIESGAPELESLIYCAGSAKLTALSCDWNNGGSDVPHVIFEGGYGTPSRTVNNFHGCTFSSGAGTPALAVAGTGADQPTGRVDFISCVQNGTEVPPAEGMPWTWR